MKTNSFELRKIRLNISIAQFEIKQIKLELRLFEQIKNVKNRKQALRNIKKRLKNEESNNYNGMIQLKENLEDKLCDYCPLDEDRRKETPSNPSGCEGSHCEEAFDNYLDEFNLI